MSIDEIFKELKVATITNNSQRKAEIEHYLLLIQQTKESLELSPTWLSSTDNNLQFYAAQTLLWHTRKYNDHVKEHVEQLAEYLKRQIQSCSGNFIGKKLEQAFSALLINSYPQLDLLQSILAHSQNDDSIFRILKEILVELARYPNLTQEQYNFKHYLGSKSEQIIKILLNLQQQPSQASLELFCSWCELKSFRHNVGMTLIPLFLDQLLESSLATTNDDDDDDSQGIIEDTLNAILTWLESGVEGLKLIILLPHFMKLGKVLETFSLSGQKELFLNVARALKLFGELIVDELCNNGPTIDPQIHVFLSLLVDLTIHEHNYNEICEIGLFWTSFVSSIESSKGPSFDCIPLLSTILEQMISTFVIKSSKNDKKIFLETAEELILTLFKTLGMTRMTPLLLNGIQTFPSSRAFCCWLGSVIIPYVNSNDPSGIPLISQIMDSCNPLLTLPCLAASIDYVNKIDKELELKTALYALDHFLIDPKSTIPILKITKTQIAVERMWDLNKHLNELKGNELVLLWELLCNSYNDPSQRDDLLQYLNITKSPLLLKIFITTTKPSINDTQIISIINHFILMDFKPLSTFERHSLTELFIEIVKAFVNQDQQTTWTLLNPVLQQAASQRDLLTDFTDFFETSILFFSDYKGFIIQMLKNISIIAATNAHGGDDDTLVIALALINKALRGTSNLPEGIDQLQPLLEHRLVIRCISDDYLKGIVKFLQFIIPHSSQLLNFLLESAKNVLTASQLEIIAPLFLQLVQENPMHAKSIILSISTQIDAGLLTKICACKTPKTMALYLGQLFPK